MTSKAITKLEQAAKLVPKGLDWPSDPRARVQTVAKLMADGHWVKGKTGKVLAEQTGTNQSTMNNYAAEASRYLDMLDDRDHMRTRIVRRLDRIAADESSTDAAVIAASKVMLDAMGKPPEPTVPPQRVTPENRAEVIATLVEHLANPTDVMREALATAGWARIETEGVEM